jgi:hypothetical protein
LKILAACVALVACSRAAETIPTTSAPLKLDGELGEHDWSVRSLRHVLTGPDGAPARPYSQIQLLHDEGYVYLGLYAADENIQSNEFFDLHLGALALHANVIGTVTPAVPGLRVAVDRDGTLDDPSNDDEEWVLEIAVPIATVVPGVWTIGRCDTPKDGVERCGSWSGQIAFGSN